jgi:hypothetical protein
MDRLQEFQVAARGDGFVEVQDNEDGSVAWFRNALPDPETNVQQRDRLLGDCRLQVELQDFPHRRQHARLAFSEFCSISRGQ